MCSGLGLHGIPEGDDVPRNAAIITGGFVPDVSDAELRDSAGRLVRMVESIIQSAQVHGQVHVFRPIDLLEPDSAYVFTAQPHLHGQFQTGRHIDDAPPPEPEVVGFNYSRKRTLRKHGGWRGVQYRVQHAGVLLLLDHQNRATLDEEALNGWVPAMTGGQDIWLGDTGCSWSLEKDDWRDETHVRFKTVDPAGNVSAWSSNAPVPTSSCQTSPGAPFIFVPVLPFWRPRRLRGGRRAARHP